MEQEAQVGKKSQARSCPKCEGEMIQASFEILNILQTDWGGRLVLGPHKAFYLSPGRRSPVEVFTCEKCGYIESYATKPQGLRV